MKHILTIVGARPQFVKAAVVSKSFLEAGIGEEIVHTGQHYDPNMSAIFWEELRIPEPAFNLGVGSGTHGLQTATMIESIEKLLMEKSYDGILVYGDTNSTLAAAIAASKLHIPVVHVEAGLRSYNRNMPEEINRVVTDHISTLLFCSSQTGVDNLKKEGITQGVLVSGDVMHDAVDLFLPIAEKKVDVVRLLGDSNFVLATIHRPSNTDVLDRLQEIVSALGQLPMRVIWPVHPRNKHSLEKLILPPNLDLREPFSYLEMLLALKKCHTVITDSGGLQKEAYWSRKPCITVRQETEWVETLEGGWNQLLPNVSDLKQAFDKRPSSPNNEHLYGDGKSSSFIAQAVLKH